ncbi:hypothetical protein LDL08_09340 [Nonomuraea glycinis]|uniref:Uncharacterized protein n=1 Tax=Nonomuraea glycinis TaxID=2047744 RepID=A0A918A5Y5_9ACTN|nr:hypothetical protein [Nonomuraea glycinis]MCA2176385.1 hypothetical protein [Nonomuraea glycinis]GGP07274.1 hypothetical protein GCM10012278_34390 [Nonomuraea glycinis]
MTDAAHALPDLRCPRMSLIREDHPVTALRHVPPADPPVRAASEVDPYPGDTHWYDLPDDDAEPEERTAEVVSRWRFWRTVRD